tara:strand:+ start:320 stop:472 length:153 start_codon:yes stop_codon:yes gene_type:complete
MKIDDTLFLNPSVLIDKKENEKIIKVPKIKKEDNFLNEYLSFLAGNSTNL